MVKLILLKKELCHYCKKFKASHNFDALKKKLESDTETSDIKIIEYEIQKDIKDIEVEISTALSSGKIVGVPTLCLFYSVENWEIIDIDAWIDENNNIRDIDKILNNIKDTLVKLKNSSSSKIDVPPKNVIILADLSKKKKYIKYKTKYLQLKNKYLQQK